MEGQFIMPRLKASCRWPVSIVTYCFESASGTRNIIGLLYECHSALLVAGLIDLEIILSWLSARLIYSFNSCASPPVTITIVVVLVAPPLKKSEVPLM